MNIVTIDFDIVMHKSLGLYNDLVNEDEFIDSVLNRNTESNFIPNVDLSLYNYLTQYLLKVTKSLPQNKIIFIDDHDEVATYIENNIKGNFNIINIDFHHDIAYTEDDQDGPIEELDCGNWVKYLLENQRQYFKEYIWVNSDESGEYEADLPFSKKQMSIHNINLYSLENLAKTTEYLFLCKSEPWVPFQARQLYELWKDIVDNSYKI